MGRADVSPDNLADLWNQIEAAAENTAASQIDAAMANAVEEIVAPG